MKQMKNYYLLILLSVCAVLASCHKDDNNNTSVPPFITNGLFVLNQGGFPAGNNSTLTTYDFSTNAATPDIFSTLNSTVLGSVGNDVETYGSKTYIVMNESNNVTVINSRTAKLIGRISFLNNTVPRLPRSIAFYGGKAFVTSYDSKVSVIDTATLTITKTIDVGANPEQIVVSNGKLYVANSGGLQTTKGNTVSVIDPTSLTVTKTITVDYNPVNLAADAYNEVYVLAQPVYDANFSQTKPSSITVINTTTDVAGPIVPTDLGFGSDLISISGDFAYYFGGDNKVKVYNVKTKTSVSTSFVTDGTTFASPYALTVNAATGEVYVSDALDYASNGTVYAFDKNGKKEYSFKAGIIPGKILLIKN